jgi:3-hydroxyisobutyrate dehydrogenase-like beta-hydroxyacid dehydrogenase
VTTNVGVLGVGTLGSIFAARLVDAGRYVTVFDLDAARVATLTALGATAAHSVGDLARAGTVLVSLPDPEATRRAVLGSGGLIESCAAGALVIDTSTIDPDTAREVGRACAEHVVDYVEAPLSGGDDEGSGVDAARAAATTFICGGSAAAVERARPLLGLLGRHIVHVGRVGDAATAKLVSNHMAGLHNLVAAEALAVGRAAGLSLETMLDVLRHTDGKSYWLFNYLVPRLRRGDFDDGFAIDLQHKDHRLFGELASRAGVKTPMNDVALRLYDAMRTAGLGRKDVTEAANIASRAADPEVGRQLIS